MVKIDDLIMKAEAAVNSHREAEGFSYVAYEETWHILVMLKEFKKNRKVSALSSRMRDEIMDKLYFWDDINKYLDCRIEIHRIHVKLLLVYLNTFHSEESE